MFEQLIELMESISRSGILYLIVSPLLLAVFIALRIYGNRIRKLTRLQQESEQSFRELNKKLAEEKVKVDRIVSEEKGKIERLLIEEKARREKALSEVEKQKEIARIAASISNEQANKLMVFSNIAEEFRTPLTLITVPIENALNGRYGKIPTSLREHLEAATGKYPSPVSISQSVPRHFTVAVGQNPIETPAQESGRFYERHRWRVSAVRIQTTN